MRATANSEPDAKAQAARASPSTDLSGARTLGCSTTSTKMQAHAVGPMADAGDAPGMRKASSRSRTPDPEADPGAKGHE